MTRGVRHATLVAVRGPISENPRRLGKPLVGELGGMFSARRGDYRIIYSVEPSAGLLHLTTSFPRWEGDHQAPYLVIDVVWLTAACLAGRS